DWLHREGLFLLHEWASEEYGRPFAELDPDRRHMLEERLERELRTNTFDPDADVIVVSPARARAIDAMSRYYTAIFGDAEEFPADIQFLADDGRSPPELRDAYAIATNTVSDVERQRQLQAFFFWAAWACTTERPGEPGDYGGVLGETVERPTYTNNWPAEPLIDNAPSSAIVVWSLLS